MTSFTSFSTHQIGRKVYVAFGLIFAGIAMLYTMYNIPELPKPFTTEAGSITGRYIGGGVLIVAGIAFMFMKMKKVPAIIMGSIFILAGILLFCLHSQM